jgi:peptidoglycan/LPS O-acetylase OafA/YrhL
MSALPIDRRADVRPEIQALRALAVAVVVVCHFWPAALPGGYVGVDVFFAISGFLITSHLLREVARTGTVSLAAFWARRARRILPAALLVLGLCTAGTSAFVPAVHWEQFFAEIRASAGYVQNWQLAHTAVDYFASGDGPSPVQHFWSLSAEEQFYLVWPVLILVAAAVHRRAIGVALTAVTAASLAYAIHKTGSEPAAAYFITPTRAWEFGAGGLLALVKSPRPTAATSSVASWAGLAAIAVASIAYSAGTAFPGYAALLPVLGAVVVMWAGAPLRRWAPTRAFELAPVQFIGDISYGIYLWHWPLLVIAPYAFTDGIPKIALLVITVALAAATKRLVEDPIRRGRFLTRRRARWTFACAAAATGFVIATAAEGSSQLQREIQTAERHSNAVVAANPRCFGAAARDPDHRCTNPSLRLTVVPTPAEAHRRRNFPCGLVEERGYLYVCSFGVSADKAGRTVALVGDSHAAHWRAALEVVGRRRHWRGLSLSHTGCPLSTTVHASLQPPARAQCLGWNRQVLQWLEQHPEIKTLIVSAIAGGVRDREVDAAGGYLAAWKALPASIEHIVVIRDTPKVRGATDDCVADAISRHTPAGPACRVPRSNAVSPDPEVAAAGRLRTRDIAVVDMTRFMCDARWCYPVIGGALVFKDQNHLTEVFARTLGPYLARSIGA